MFLAHFESHDFRFDCSIGRCAIIKNQWTHKLIPGDVISRDFSVPVSVGSTVSIGALLLL